jgi:N-methylhydantoinase B
MSEDGVSATVCINDGDTHNSPNEQTEAKFPIVVENYALIPDSGGAGKFRGGLGVERISRARSQITVNSQIDRVHCKPWGLEGGGDGAGNELAIRSNGKWQESFNNAKFIFDIKKEGDAFRIRAGGGGGYGNPWERPIEKVREDVRQGYVSVKAAEELYGVMIDAVSFIVDVRATEKKRTEMGNSARA